MGASGQDGSLVCDLLLEKGYIVYGVIRRASNFNTQRIEHILDKIHLFYGDLTDPLRVLEIIKTVQPHEIYNFAAQSHVKVSCDNPWYTTNVNSLGVLSILEAVRILGLHQKTKVYNAMTSEMYGNVTDGTVKLTEDTPMIPVSPYGIGKLAAYHLGNYYRDGHNMFVVNSILLNHEGERRGPTFVTQKIAQFVGKYKKTGEGVLLLGNLNACRDFGYAKDYVEGIYLMMQNTKPENFVLATGEEHSVREFAELAFKRINITIEWKGTGDQEKGYNSVTQKLLVSVDPEYYRPIDIHHLIGDYSKAKRILGWEPKVKFRDIVQRMVDAALL